MIRFLLLFILTINIFAVPIIKDIKFSGLKTLKINENIINYYIKSKVGDYYNLSLVSRDMKDLFANDLFSDIQVDCVDENQNECSDSSKFVYLTYILKENPAISKVVIEGYEEMELEEIEGVVNMTANSILKHSELEQNVQKIKDLYVENGYFLSDVSSSLIYSKDKSNVKVIFNIDENAKTLIKSIKFVGNKNISSKEFKSVMLTKEGGYFSDATDSGIYKEQDLERDLAVIKLYCQEKGFFKASVSEPAEIRLSKDKKEMDIIIYINEGPKYYFKEFSISGDIIGKKEKLIKPFKDLEGKLFKRSSIAMAVQGLTNYYKTKSYADVNISTPLKIDEKNKTISIPLFIEKGEKSYIERIEFSSNDMTRDKVLRRELRIYEGDKYNESLIQYSKNRLFSLGYFETVEIIVQDGTVPGRKVLVFEVKERPTGTFQVGAGYSTVEKLVFNAQISKNNLFGNGHNIALMAQISKYQKYYSISFNDPYFFDTLWDFSIRLYNTTMLYNFFTKKTFGSSVTIGHPITDFLRAYITLKAENVNVEQGGRISSGTDIPPIYGLFRDGRTVSLTGKLVYDKRNNRMFPTKGFYQELTVENASYLSENKFTKISTDTRFYFPLFWTFVYRLNVRTGWLPFTKNVPIFERYYVGGIFTVRGFEWGHLSPSKMQISSPSSGLSDFQIGGNKQLIINNEIEFDIVKAARIKGVMFIDSGNAFLEEDAMNVLKLRHSWGFGVRWFSPMGPLRFEWGFPFKPREGEKSYMFEFNIGNSF